MKKLQTFLAVIFLLSFLSVHAAAKEDIVQDLYNLVLDATEDQNLAQTARTTGKYRGAGATIARAIKNKADELVTKSKQRADECDAKVAAAEQRATTAEAQATTAATAARLLPPEVRERDTQIAALTRQLQQANDAIKALLDATNKKILEALEE